MLGRHFKKDVGFFGLFNSHAASTLDGARVLTKLLDGFPPATAEMERLEQLEQQCDTLTHQTVDLLHKTFITPLDRDEIVRLISRLDDIMDAIHFTAKRMHILEVPYAPQYLKDLGQILLQATERVKALVELIKGFNHMDKMRRLAGEVHKLENEGDTVLAAGMSQLFRDSANNPLVVIKLKEILESVEVAIDRCEDVANIVEGLYLEHG
jgi:uncharacterized protein Yka (UPF0111/DUF47 family)